MVEIFARINNPMAHVMGFETMDQNRWAVDEEVLLQFVWLEKRLDQMQPPGVQSNEPQTGI
jgi:hypothetical protein